MIKTEGSMEIDHNSPGIARCFENDGEIPPLPFPIYSIRNGPEFGVILWEEAGLPGRHGYKILAFNQKGFREIVNSGAEFYSRKSALQIGMKNASAIEKYSCLYD